MRKELLRILRCPDCKSRSLLLHVEQENEQEVSGGRLICTSCGREYRIESGIAELMPVLDKETLRERQVRDLKMRDWEVERQRPYINETLECPWVWPSFAANVEQGLAQIALKNVRALDIGAATCWSTRMLSERGACAVALDISTGMLRDGGAQFATGVYFDRVAATMTDLPFVDNAFGVVFASASLHHASNLRQAFSEVARVLRPGDTAVVVNEPVCGLLTDSSSFGREDKAHGINEHIYQLHDYLTAAHSAGLVPRVLFPAALDGQLRGQIPSPPSQRFRMAQRVWMNIPKSLRRLSLMPAHILVGLTLVMAARKAAP